MHPGIKASRHLGIKASRHQERQGLVRSGQHETHSTLWSPHFCTHTFSNSPHMHDLHFYLVIHLIHSTRHLSPRASDLR